MLCTSCGRENDADARFCDACGALLDAPPDAGETRRVVTVVFTDVTGSTAASQALHLGRIVLLSELASSNASQHACLTWTSASWDTV